MNPYFPASISGDNVLYQGISSLYPRAESKSFTIRNDSPNHPFDFSIGDIFRFRISYTNGVLLASGNIYRAESGTIISETYTVTITDVTKTSFPFMSIFSSLAIVSIVLLQINKRGKKP